RGALAGGSHWHGGARPHRGRARGAHARGRSATRLPARLSKLLARRGAHRLLRRRSVAGAALGAPAEARRKWPALLLPPGPLAASLRRRRGQPARVLGASQPAGHSAVLLRAAVARR